MTTAHTRCRICGTALPKPFLDFGAMPLANAFLSSPDEFADEARYPLAVCLCPRCGLVQLSVVVPPEQLFRRYLYVSSTSEAVRRYAAELAARTVARYGLGPSALVCEIGSNDGLVLGEFRRRGVRVLGVEPARNIAAVARENGVPTIEEFFSLATARTIADEHGAASVLLGRHVFAHIDDVHDFFQGVDRLLASDGVLLIEVPYAGHLMRQMEFDTIYHEHLSYVALAPVQALCEQHGFRLIDVEWVSLHGGSMLLAMTRRGSTQRPSARLEEALREERRLGLTDPAAWDRFAEGVMAWKARFERFVEEATQPGVSWIGYGAAAKSSTLLNFCPSVAGRLRYILDRNPHKQGRYAPGTHLPVVDTERWRREPATHLVILAWNFQDEIIVQMRPFAEAGGRFVVPIPEPRVVESAWASAA